MTPANDSRFDALLDAGLGALPREHAGDDFTERVLEEVRLREGRSQWRPLAAALALLAVGMGTYSWNEQRERQEAIERIASLRAEYEVLQNELAGLQNAKRARGVVHLGGSDDVELVLDLGRLVRQKAVERQAEPGSGGVLPAVAQAL